LEDLRRGVGYVPQEALLFSGTIRDNVRFGREGVGEARVLEACEVARLGKDLAGFSHGLDTRVGVRGLALSGGQKQRVALARALAGRPRILVLDDVTAALDAQTESALWEELHRVLPDLATLVVTHRTATLERADRILVLDRGRLVEQGTHAELSERGSVYRSIYRRHTLEERLGAECGPDPVPDAEHEAAPEGE
jgi:ATP-binding cassette subfamily B protein